MIRMHPGIDWQKYLGIFKTKANIKTKVILDILHVFMQFSQLWSVH